MNKYSGLHKIVDARYGIEKQALPIAPLIWGGLALAGVLGGGRQAYKGFRDYSRYKRTDPAMARAALGSGLMGLGMTGLSIVPGGYFMRPVSTALRALRGGRGIAGAMQMAGGAKDVTGAMRLAAGAGRASDPGVTNKVLGWIGNIPGLGQYAQRASAAIPRGLTQGAADWAVKNVPWATNFANRAAQGAAQLLHPLERGIDYVSRMPINRWAYRHPFLSMGGAIGGQMALQASPVGAASNQYSMYEQGEKSLRDLAKQRTNMFAPQYKSVSRYT